MAVAELHKAIVQLMQEQRERPAESVDPPLLRELLAQVFADGAAEDPLLEAFTRQLWGKSDLPAASAEEIAAFAAMTRNAFRFVRDRGLQRMAVRVYRPTLEAYGWESPDAVVETVLDDRPFIVDTLRDAIQAAGGEIRRLLHPILGVRRDARGLLTDLGPPDTPAHRESFFHCEVANLAASAALEAALTERLTDVVLITNDYQAMRERVAELAAELRARPLPAGWDDEREEIAGFLDWLGQKSFVYLGYREYDLAAHGATQRATVHPGSGLGLLRREERSRYRSAQPLAADLWQRLREPPVLIVSKTGASSPVHRTAPMDYIAVKRVDASGTVTGERRLLGLFTSKAHHEDTTGIPLLRRRLQTVLEQEGAVEDSHDYKDLEAVFNSFPKEELLASRTNDIRAAVRAVVTAEGQVTVRVLCHPDAFRRGLFVTVIVPRRRFSTELHRQISRDLLARLEATSLHQHLALDERTVARLHYYVAVPSEILQHPPLDTLERELNDRLRSWEDALREQIARALPSAEADRTASKYLRVFPSAYRAATDVVDAVRDIRCLELVTAHGAQYELHGEVRGEPGLSALKLYLAGERLILSEFIPELENLGLRVFGQDFTDLVVPDLGGVRIHTFFVEDAARGGPLKEARAAPLLLPALRAVRTGQVENDPLNRLVLSAGLEWRAVDLLRTYVEYGRQSGLASRPLLIEALVTNPQSAKDLWAFFAAKFDPAASVGSPAERLRGPVAEAEAAFRASVDAVESLAHDRVLRALGASVAATVRTTFYRPPSEGPWDPAIAIKIESSRVPHLMPPRPAYEVYVHGLRMEGIHVRAGRVARGGIRSSDRPDDFRSEILGLMKTQVVKNAVIVPVGAKGGFVITRRRDERQAVPEQIERAYGTLIASLLSLTDNLEHGSVVFPPGQVIYDGPDPYLVVAADKGTATFSDLANRIAARHQFWLGDAFASGGAQGYDHKKLGITARGAWESVRQHFREMGRDPEREPLTVIGIGDMSGDVFGNGLLRSRTVQLRAAFDHLHIFLDPAPDPERSYAERERLFHLPSSSWSDYDPGRLSAGGGVFLRSAKSIALSEPARALLGIAHAAPSGEEVVRAILQMEADLLWHGGIGTYVKASDEPHANVGDPSNDAVRVNAADLRVRVVAEGGNLGFTQRARVEFALAGGRINTDAIDNSAGVDLSDHEVNLKIALQGPVQNREISLVERNALLADLTDEVCAQVLAHNRRQAFLLTRDQLRSRTELLAFRDLVVSLESEASFDRQREGLPTREELRARRGSYLGLTRPELAVLLAHTKLHLQAQLLHSSLIDDAPLEGYLRAYFPRLITERFPHAIRQHSLRREITAVELANRVIDDMGMTFLVRVVRDTGRPLVDVVRGWVAAVAISGSDGVLRQLETASTGLTLEVETNAYALHETAIEQATKWIVEMQSPSATLRHTIERFLPRARQLVAQWPDHLDDEPSARYEAAVARLVEHRVPDALAEALTRLTAIVDVLEISSLAEELGAELPIISHAYFRTAALLDLDWVRRSLSALGGADDRWQRRAAEGLLEGLLHARRELTRQVLAGGEGRADVDERVSRYAETHRAELDGLLSLINDLKATPQPPLAALVVVMRALGRLARG